MSISISSYSPYWLTARNTETTTSQTTAETETGIAAQATETTSKTATVANGDILPSTATTATASTVTATQEVESEAPSLTAAQIRSEELQAAQSKQDVIAAWIKYWQAPIPEDELTKRAEAVVDIQNDLDISVERPTYHIKYDTLLQSGFVEDSAYQGVYETVPQKANWLRKIDEAMPDGYRLDSSINSFYQTLSRNMEYVAGQENAVKQLEAQIQAAKDPAARSELAARLKEQKGYADNAHSFLSSTLQYFYDGLGEPLTDFHREVRLIPEEGDIFAYIREVIFQRTSVELGEGVDIAKMMNEYGLINGEEYAALPALTLPQDSEKLTAYAEKYAAKVEAERIAKAEAAANAKPEINLPIYPDSLWLTERATGSVPSQEELHAASQRAMASYKLPPHTIMIYGDDIPGIDLNGKMLVIHIPGQQGNTTRIDQNDINRNLHQSADGTITATGGYVISLRDITPEMQDYFDLAGISYGSATSSPTSADGQQAVYEDALAETRQNIVSNLAPDENALPEDILSSSDTVREQSKSALKSLGQ